MILVVDDYDDLIKFSYRDAADFSLTGKYAIQIDDALGIDSNQSNVPANAIAAKLQAYQAGRSFTIIDSFQEEFLNAIPVTIDTANSDRYILGKNKRTAMLPGGYITTTNIPITVASTKFFCHWHGFYLNQISNAILPFAIPRTPNSVYYNNASLFSPSTFTVELYQSGGPLLATLVSDVETTLGAFGPGNVVLKIINSHPTITYNLSDVILLSGN